MNGIFIFRNGKEEELVKNYGYELKGDWNYWRIK